MIKLIPTKIESPSELLTHIYNSQLENIKNYDLFLSHSSNNKELLIEIKSILNSLDINVYVDWINDKEGLKRTLTNADTAQVIIERLKASNGLMFVYSKDSLNSLWTPWEIGYFHSLKGKICVYYPEEVDESKVPAYINMYPKVFFKENGFIVKIEEVMIPIGNWINFKNQ